MNSCDPKDLLGRAEDERLEFKAKDVLRHPATVARVVVAFLNKDGGHLWIGVDESEGRATKLDPVDNPQQAITRLRDYLLDTIEPVIQIPDEVDLADCDGLIHLSVNQGKDPPYAHRDGGRHFEIRAGARLRVMTREEIKTAFARESSSQEQSREILEKRMVEVLRRQAEEGAAHQQLWLTLVPVADTAVSIDFTNETVKDRVKTWLMDPRVTGNRPTGWTFENAYVLPRFPADGECVVQDAPKHYSMRTTIKRNGEITFSIALEALYWKGNDTDPRDIYPYALLEYPTSVFRLAAKLLDEYWRDRETKKIDLVVGFALGQARGWRLRPGSPRPLFARREPQTVQQDLLELGRPLVFSAEEMRTTPDRCGLRLARAIYGRFGFEEDDIPNEFDHQTGELRIE